MKKRVRHFDVNDTVTMTDSTNKLGREKELLILLSKHTIIDGKSHYDSVGKDKEKATNILNDFPYLESIYNLMVDHKEFFLPSFLKFLKTCDDKIVFRTFGVDGGLVIEEMKKISERKFIVGKMEIVNDIAVLNIDNKSLSGIDEIFDFIENSDCDILINEDYNYWNKNGKKNTHGKILCERNKSHIFFDDNDCVYVLKGTFVKVNTIDAFMDEDYFIKY